MANNEIYEQLKQVTPEKWQEIKTLLSEQSSDNRANYLRNTDTKAATALDYLIHAVIEDDYNGKTTRNSVGWSIMNTFSIFRNSASTIRNSRELIIDLPTEFLKYLPSNIQSRLKKLKREEELEASARALQLNEFSYLAFKASLDTMKKKPSGIEAIAQIKKLPKPTTIDENIIYDKFLAAYWNNIPIKSIGFCETIVSNSQQTEFSPIKIMQGYKFNIEDVLKEQQTNEVYISLALYQQIAREYNIPVLRELYTDQYSEHHDWISNVPKKNLLTTRQLDMTISQIIILDYIIKNIQKDTPCPYFIKMKNFLLKEVDKPEYNTKEILTNLLTSYKTATQLLEELI